MNFGLSIAKFSARYLAVYRKFDLSKPKIQVAQLSDFIFVPVPNRFY